jgi:hypothetical protein
MLPAERQRSKIGITILIMAFKNEHFSTTDGKYEITTVSQLH